MGATDSPGFAEASRPEHVRLVIERMMQDGVRRAAMHLSSPTLTREQQVRLAMWVLMQSSVRIRRMEPMVFGRGNEAVYR